MNANETKKLADLELEIDGQIAKVRRERRLVLGVGLFLWLFIMMYFGYFARQIAAAMQPKILGGYITGEVSHFVMTLSEQYAKEAEKLAPDYATNIFASIEGNIPVARKEAQMFLLGWFEEQFTRVDGLLTRMMDDVITTHLAEIKPMVSKLDTPEGKKAFEDYVTSIIAAPLKSEQMKMDIENVNVTLDMLVNRLQRLANGTGLTAEEKNERELLLAFREYMTRNK